MEIGLDPAFSEALAQALLEARGRPDHLATRTHALEQHGLAPGEAALLAAQETLSDAGVSAEIVAALSGDPDPAPRLLVVLAGASGESLRLLEGEEDGPFALLALTPNKGVAERGAALLATWRAAYLDGRRLSRVDSPSPTGGTPGCAAGTAVAGFDRGGPLLGK